MSSKSGTSPSSTSPPQDPSTASSSPATERSHGEAPGNWRESPKNQNKIKKRDNNRDPDGRWRGLPEWLEEITENLKNTEVPAPAHISHDSDSEHPAKVTLKKHSVYTHLPKDRNCETGLRTKITRAPCRRRTGEAVPQAEHFGDLITADHTVLNEEGESRNNHRYAVVVQDLATQWIQFFPCKTKTSQEVKNVQESFSNHQKSRESFTLTIHCNLANLVKFFHGIIKLRHLMDPRRTVLVRDRCAE